MEFLMYRSFQNSQMYHSYPTSKLLTTDWIEVIMVSTV